MEGHPPLFYAAQKGDCDEITRLLKLGADVNVENSDFNYSTPLWVAASKGHHDAVKLLLAAGADSNKTNCYYASPLWAASYFGHIEVVNLLISAGANVNPAVGVPPLWMAASNGFYSTVKKLCKAGANIYRTNEDGISSLVGSNDPDVEKFLVKWDLTNICLAMAALNLPAYVILWILQFSHPEVETLKELDVIIMIQGIHNTRRRIKAAH